MEKETALDLALLQIVNELLVLLRTQSCGDDGLRLAARKERRAMDARQPADLAVYGSNL